MQSASERSRINDYLGRRGLGQLGDPGLIAQLAYLIYDDAAFARLLGKCEISERRNMYEALVPCLRFVARPYAEYLIEASERAERMQVPTIAEDGTLEPFRVQELTSTLRQATATERLVVVCRRCTREALFGGPDRLDAIQAARDAGWRYYRPPAGEDGYEICPDCEAQLGQDPPDSDVWKR